MNCPSCGSTSDAGRKFCAECGARLARACPACGTPNEPAARFCGECGGALVAAAYSGRPAPTPDGPARAVAVVAERRLVSVLFADLVGFTGLAEDRDPEAVRELLTRYFDLCREVISRYGGTVEKFIGDAVMAVWGAPVAHEDDAERAVRAALDLVDVVRGLGSAGSIVVQARAAVLTGSAAVTVGATDQGLVAGDLVNTASRLQSVAPPGSVLVGEATYKATAEAIAYEPAGEQVLKGKTAPVEAWRARRVVAKIGGVGRAEGLEPPFVGRDQHLRLLKDLLHATGRERGLRFVSVTGAAGTGKSRLTWEFLKYIDGLVDTILWHQGRSPAYGEGITFCALGEMVRKRAGLAEGDDPETTRAKIASALDEYVSDEAERRWIEPKLLGLLGLEELRSVEREELFGAWRTFFERVSEHGTTVLVFEDIHWADQGLLDFIDHLAEWSIQSPILLVTLARPEFLDRHRAWGAGRRNFVALSLDPLADASMDELLSGIVPGLPQEARAALLARAEGIPLYAVETVRKLLLDGRLERSGDAFRPVGDLSHLEVPDTLHALIAARLDGLEPDQRSLLQDASILGQTFSVAALAGVTASDPVELEPRLRDLVRGEVLVQNRDPRSPERGQYGFVQALIREVAYGLLSRRDRRARHLAAARYFESLGDDELAGALATHYLDAYRASDEGAEADAVAGQARIALRAAAERAAALHSPTQALAYLEPAIGLSRDAHERAALLHLSGRASEAAGMLDAAEVSFREAIALYEEQDDWLSAARATESLGLMFALHGRASDSLAVLEPFMARTRDLADAPEVLHVGAALARASLFADQFPRALEVADQVLVAAERIDDVALVADAVITKGTALMYSSRYREGLVLLAGGLQLAEAHGLAQAELRARMNTSFMQVVDDPRQASATARAGLDRARRLGLRNWTVLLASNFVAAGFALGDWDALLALSDELLGTGAPLTTDQIEIVGVPMAVYAFRGEVEAVADAAGRFETSLGSATASQEQTMAVEIRMFVELSGGRLDDVLAHDLTGAERQYGFHCHVLAADAAVWSRDLGRVQVALAGIAALRPAGRWAAASRLAATAGAAALEGRAQESEAAYREALDGLRELGALRDVALVAMDRVAASADDGAAAAAADEARQIWDRLRAGAMLDRLDALLAARAGRAHASPAPASAGSPVPV